MKPSELLQRIVKPESVLDRGALYELGRELDRILGDGDSQYRQARNLAESLALRTWIPTLWQNGVQLACTVDYAIYQTLPETVKVWARLTPTAVGAVGQILVKGLPHACTQFTASGTFMMDAAGGNHVGVVVIQKNTSELGFWKDAQANWLGTTPAFALGLANAVRFFAEYPRQP